VGGGGAAGQVSSEGMCGAVASVRVRVAGRQALEGCVQWRVWCVRTVVNQNGTRR